MRKRKRRPQISVDGEEVLVRPRLRRPVRPDRLDQHRDEWREEMMSEEPFRALRPYKRRRLYPKFEELESTTSSSTEKTSSPPVINEGNLKVAPTKRVVQTTTRAPIDLKALLKQAGGISLSELLQRKNLSLDDLLKGDGHALSVLTSVDDVTPANNSDENDTIKDLTEATTDRRIFVPSHPKYYTSINFKPDMKDLSMEKVTTTEINDEENSVETTLSSTPVSSTKPPKRITLPPTLAKLRNLYAKTTKKPETTVPENAIKISINELFGYGTVIKSTTEGPLKISVEIGEILKETSTTEIESEETTPPKIQPISARDEIQEILSDTMSREQLLSVLEARNMTLDELFEQRERGSSQRHLADIFHNKTREPEPKDDVIVSHIIKNTIPIKPFKPAFLEHSTYEIRQIFPKLEEPFRESRQKQAEDYNIINNPLFRTDSKKTNEVINKLIPVWRQAYTNIHKPPIEDVLLKDEAHRVEEIENQIAEAVNGALNVDTVSHQISDDDYFQLPSGVRSAIIASATIVGISVFVFVTIFIIFKWSQKRSKHMSYSNSLSSLKLRSPILETQYQKRIFGSLMNSTLGRKKKLSTVSSSEPHSLQDYLWENDRKPFQ